MYLFSEIPSEYKNDELFTPTPVSIVATGSFLSSTRPNPTSVATFAVLAALHLVPARAAAPTVRCVHRPAVCSHAPAVRGTSLATPPVHPTLVSCVYLPINCMIITRSGGLWAAVGDGPVTLPSPQGYADGGGVADGQRATRARRERRGLVSTRWVVGTGRVGTR